MVKVINYKEIQREDGSSFFLLEVQSGVEMVKSQQTGNYYATVKKAMLACTFDEPTCKYLIGSEIPGRIEKITVAPYDYVIKQTGETITLHHRYVYLPDGVPSEDEKLAKEIEAAMASHLEIDAM